MAKRQVVSYNYTCDVCGGTIPESDGDSATHKFSWEGSDYLVDVCSTHAVELDDILAQLKNFVAAGQRASGRRGRKPGGAAAASAPKASRDRRSGASAATAATAPKRGDLGAVRAWARQSGLSVSERGRVPASLLEAYDAANSAPAPVDEPVAAAESAPATTVATTPKKARARRTSAPAAAPSTDKRTDLAAVRAWARETGIGVSARGRIPGSLLEAYDAAHAGAEAPAAEEAAPAAAPTRKRGGRKAAPARKRAARKATSTPAS
jgi:Lsr2